MPDLDVELPEVDVSAEIPDVDLSAEVGELAAEVDAAAGILQELRVYPDRVSLTYQWHPQLMNEARDSLLTGMDSETLRHYHDRLVQLQRDARQGLSRRRLPFSGQIHENSTRDRRSDHAGTR